MEEMTLPTDVKEGKTIMPAEWCMCQLMNRRSSLISLLPQIVEIALTMPISNAWPERGASQVKLIKTRLRSRMSNDMLAGLLNIAMNGPEVNSHECDTLVKMTTEKWLSGRRYNLSKGKSAAREAHGTSEKEPTLIETTSASTQTETTEEGSQVEQEQQQQEEQALSKLGLAHCPDDPGCDFSDSE